MELVQKKKKRTKRGWEKDSRTSHTRVWSMFDSE